MNAGPESRTKILPARLPCLLLPDAWRICHSARAACEHMPSSNRAGFCHNFNGKGCRISALQPPAHGP